MGKSKIGLIARREFNERVRKKSFIITTILTPLLMVGVMVLMVWLMNRENNRDKEILVIDRSGIVAPQLTDEGTLHYRPADRTLDEMRREAPADAYGILLIGEDIMTNPRAAELYTYESSTVDVEQAVSDQIRRIIEDRKLKAYNIENLDTILAEIDSPITLQTKTISETGETKDSSSILSMASAYIFGLLIYMFVFMYGTMVMQGVIEEKSNKVLEVMVSSVRPFELMMGKILGIASVALTQLLIWVAFITIVGGAALNYFAGDMLQAASAMNAGTAMPMEMDPDTMDQAVMLSRLTDVRYMLTLVGGFIVYFIGGYLLYAAMFAAVGSAVDNEKDTQNLQLPITIPLLLAFFEPDPLHLARHHDGPPALRRAGLGGDRLGRAALPNLHRHGVAGRQDLPGRHLHVRQEADFQGAVQVDEIQILTFHRPAGRFYAPDRYLYTDRPQNRSPLSGQQTTYGL